MGDKEKSNLENLLNMDPKEMAEAASEAMEAKAKADTTKYVTIIVATGPAMIYLAISLALSIRVFKFLV